MAGTKPFFTRVDKAILAHGSRLAVKGAFAGSIVFGVVDTAAFWIDTYWIPQRDSAFDPGFLLFTILFFAATVVSGFILASLPAWICGRLLALVLFQDIHGPLSRGNANLMTGIAAGFTASLPVLLIQYLVTFPTGQAEPYFFLYRTLVTVLIAVCSGAWVSRKLVLRYGGEAASHSPL